MLMDLYLFVYVAPKYCCAIVPEVYEQENELIGIATHCFCCLVALLLFLAIAVLYAARQNPDDHETSVIA